jgi:hypothetical protein
MILTSSAKTKNPKTQRRKRNMDRENGQNGKETPT